MIQYAKAYCIKLIVGGGKHEYPIDHRYHPVGFVGAWFYRYTWVGLACSYRPGCGGYSADNLAT